MKHFSKAVFLPLNMLAVISVILLFFQTVAFNWFFFALGWIFISGFGVSVAMHRTFSHRAYKPNWLMKKIMLFFATVACEGSTVTWCALHRGYHHPFSDTEKDPQKLDFSKGIFYALHGWKQKLAASINFKSVPDLLRDSDHKFVHKHYCMLVLVFWLIVASAHLQFFVCAVVLPTFLSVWLNNIENIVSHIPQLGYRNYNNTDMTTNAWWFHPFGWGSGALHNNHHNSASRFFLSERWFEFDPVIIFLPILLIGKQK